MNIDSSQLTLALVRGILVVVVLFFVPKLFDSYLPKNSFLYRIWQKDEKARKFISKYYWAIGLLVFLVNIMILSTF